MARRDVGPYRVWVNGIFFWLPSSVFRPLNSAIMPHVPGLRSPYAKVGRIVFFGRMLDKIRLHAAGKLPADYHANLGEPRPAVFDARCSRFLGVPYEEMRVRTLQGGTDEEILAWAESRGGLRRTDDDCLAWNHFLMKLGLRDDRAPIIRQRKIDSGMASLPIETFFDLIEYDEGRDPASEQPWAKV
jgi:hypothetical protein